MYTNLCNVHNCNKNEGAGSIIGSPNSRRALKRQNASFSFIAFKTVSASKNIVSKRVILHASPCFHVFIFSLQFQIVSNTVIMHALDTLFSIIFLQFQIVSGNTRMHALETLFSFFLQFQIVLNTVIMHTLEILFSFCSSKSF